MKNNVLISAIFPHPPIIIPEVGGNETSKVEKTIQAVQSLSEKIVKANPDTVIIITPHSCFDHHFFNVYSDEMLSGDFSKFGAPNVKLSFKNDLGFIENLDSKCKELFNGLNKITPGTPLDHGSAVPLYYLDKAGYKGKIVVINYAGFDPAEHVIFGELIDKVADMLSRKIVFIASGDLSHKLSSTAPGGYNPDAHFFDEDIVDKISEGDYNYIMNISPILRKKAGECGFNSIMVGIGMVNKKPLNNEVLSYEAPFGVGYIVATL